MSSKDKYEEHVMHSRSDNIGFQMKSLENVLNHFLIDMKLD